ncbi:periplasmic sensor signal transduction histidine kinase [Rhodoferax ferrireducens T118]|uniref:histidine kinase n=1 Tax=Albidiferax ferrireducens (strain ATCC BAA-621 / DSM 15236 / T118) TaxID=338969 RepID=Q21RT3_ALBFT|nr:ATP-binding protein [Rhodoferax ferrireducens]ABD71520.1 periplasmic sensor signal transduction histidine kinase [Rhodoferax ferrireducens T118]
MSLPPSHSLRGRLLWLLLVAIIFLAGVQAVIAYRTALAEADVIFDYQMQQMAMSLRPGLPVGGGLDESYETKDEENFDFVIQVWTADGLRVFQSSARAELPQRAVLGFSTVQARGTTYRLFSVAAGAQVIQVAQDMAARREMAGTLALRTVSPMVLMVPLLMLVVWWVVSASLAPVSRVRRQIATRQADELGELSEDDLPDEIRPLVHELNLLFHRVRQAFDAQNNFVADAAHELRSPLAALKLQVQGLRRAADDATRDVAINRLNAGIDRATRLVEQLLVLARQQSNSALGAKAVPIDLTTLARLALADAAGAAAARQIDLGLAQADPGIVMGHEEALRILMRNLLDNAIKYTPVGGTVNLAIRGEDGQTLLTVDDSGPGIAAEDRQRVLDRFYRVAGTEGSGSGLGLAIVKTIADLHQATLSIDRSESLGGLRATVTFTRVS